MTKEELEQNLGTIAHSGSLDFKKDNKDENIDIIGRSASASTPPSWWPTR